MRRQVSTAAVSFIVSASDNEAVAPPPASTSLFPPASVEFVFLLAPYLEVFAFTWCFFTFFDETYARSEHVVDFSCCSESMNAICKTCSSECKEDRNLTISIAGADLASETAIGDRELGGESRPYRLSQQTSGNINLGPIGLAHTVSTQATSWIVRKANIDKSTWQIVRPENLAKVVRQAMSRANSLQLGKPGRVLRPH
jgi:hypothetical protein